MIDLKIGINSKKFSSLSQIDENWIKQQINLSNNTGQLFCIRVLIDQDPVNLVLATQGCSSSGGGSRLPNKDERRIFDLWNEMKLDGSGFQPEKFIIFFKRLRSIMT